MPNYNTNGANNKCCKYTSRSVRGAGAGRVLFLGGAVPNSSKNVNNYTVGSGVGVTSTANRRAILRRSSNSCACNLLTN